jgi:hypothetical protein
MGMGARSRLLRGPVPAKGGSSNSADGRPTAGAHSAPRRALQRYLVTSVERPCLPSRVLNRPGRPACSDQNSIDCTALAEYGLPDGVV